MKKLILVSFLTALVLTACGGSPTNNPATSDSGSSSSNNKLVGTWKTDCKVPDPNSKWAELHTFVFSGDNTAVYTRQSYYQPSCVGEGMKIIIKYNYIIEGEGKIMFKNLDDSVTFYDMYALNGDTLEFGHGFRNDTVFGGTGATPETRIKFLNKYLLYKKQ